MKTFSKMSLVLGGILLVGVSLSWAAAAFNEDNAKWLEAHNMIITVAPEANYPPFIFDGSEGSPTGLSIDLLQTLADETGVKLDFLPSNNLASILDSAKVEGAEFVITSLTHTTERDVYLNFTEPYVEVPTVLLVKANSSYQSISDLSQKKIAVGDEYGVQVYLEDNYNFELVPYVDDELSLKDLIFGQVDGAVMDLATASYLIDKDALTGLKMVSTLDFTYHLSFAVPEDAPELLSVLEQMMENADPVTLDEIKNKWMKLEDVSNRKYIILAFGLTGLTVFFLVLWLYSVRKYTKMQTQKLLQENKSLGEALEGEKGEIAKHVEELENTKLAMLNLLEDVSESKAYLEIEKKKRDILASNAKIGTWEWNPISKKGEWDVGMYEAFEEEKGTDPLVIRQKKMDKESYEKMLILKEKMFKGELETDQLFYTINLAKGPRYMKSAAFAQKDASGKVVKVFGVDVDVTKEKELEKMKDEFLSVASHELRTPMTAIKGLSSMILSGDYGKITMRLQRPVQDMFTVSEQLLRLINNMLDASRLESGRMLFNFSNFNPTDSIAGLTNLLKVIAREKKIKLIVKEPPQVAIFSDPDKFKEILNNLIGNALKFTKKGSITLESSEDPSKVIFYVTDTGDGIAEEDQKKLFQKFEQISSEVAGKPAGSGLGLYISKQMAQHMGGDLWIEKSKPGEGTVFAFSVLKADSPLVAKILKENQENL